MDFSYPPETERFRTELRTWLAANLSGKVIESSARRGTDDAAFETLRTWDATMADAGWAAMALPAEYGGRGAGVLEQLVYVEETTRTRVPLPLNIIGLNNIAPAILHYGTEEQKSGLLRRMIRADDIWCQGMSEPDAGSDLASLRTKAVRAGDDYIISGQKIWTSLGHRADWCQLYARTDPQAPKHCGITCFLVDMSSPGIETKPLVTLNGDADFAEIFFDEARVPAAAILGPLDGGWQVATTTLSHERAGAARLYVEQQILLEELIADLAAVEENGRRALDDPVVLGRLGKLSVRITYLEILCRRAVSAAAHGGDELRTASLAKTVWGEVGQELADTAYDLLGDGGGNGRWARHRLAARSLTIAGGTTQINKNVTAGRMLGLPRS
ncbi:acyl-CoA dehydrogenase family protein [Nocardia sp. NPDC058499]|uniref:acyl-CoA dehydrogenase family protein n=1 Tax=Nocardia sp. NPDC058499 TaxID=3346530 RepID=UPI00365381AA